MIIPIIVTVMIVMLVVLLLLLPLSLFFGINTMIITTFIAVSVYF